MTVTIELPEGEEAAWKEEAARRGMTLEDLTRQAVMEKLIANVRNQRVPQSLDELRPHRLSPPGKTAMDMIVGPWPGDETDEELQAALKAMG